MGLFDLIKDVKDGIKDGINWLSKQVQNETGETERKELVGKIKSLVLEFKVKVTNGIELLNSSIRKFNEKIRNLNSIRSNQVEKNIVDLKNELQFYGNCNLPFEFAEEYSKSYFEFPQRTYASLNDYIGEIDWTSDTVFINTLLRSPIGMRIKTKNQNLSLLESSNQLTLLISETVHELEEKNFITILETEICSSYIENILFISNFINNVVVPELYIVRSFFQAEKIKNVLQSGKKLSDNIQFTTNINSLVGTNYERHYQFIKNAYTFYVLSCKIYNTAVLTNLLNHKLTDSDKQIINNEKRLLDFQAGRVKGDLTFDYKEV